MAGTSAGAAKRARCSSCGAFQHRDPECPKVGRHSFPLDKRMAVLRGDENECWEWPWERNRWGYAILNKQRVARLLLGLEHGNPLVARHTCDNPPCVNPAHLLSGTTQDNANDMVERGRSNAGARHWNYRGEP